MNKSRVEPGQAALIRDDQLRCERLATNLCVDAQTVDATSCNQIDCALAVLVPLLFAAESSCNDTTSIHLFLLVAERNLAQLGNCSWSRFVLFAFRS